MPPSIRIPRLKAFLGILSLQTGTEIVSLILAFNKATGLYGLLAILTGFELSWLQLSTYIYSILVLGLLVYLIPHVRQKTPLECLALAWTHVIDSIMNCVYTTAFAVEWYLASTTAAEINTADDVQGATNIQQDMGVGTADKVWQGDNRHAVRAVPQDTALSLVLITSFTLARIYLSLVVVAYAQQVLKRYMDIQLKQDGSRARGCDSPFAEGMEDGDGWRGWLGRKMLSVGSSYWLDYDDQEEWAQMMGERFRKSSQGSTGGEEV